MKRTIEIDNKKIEMASNALTPLAYTEIFKNDFMRVILGFRPLIGVKPEDYTEEQLALSNARAGKFSELAFVFAKQAELKEAAAIMELTKRDYYNWLANFGTNAFKDVNVINDLLALWLDNANNNVEQKNA